MTATDWNVAFIGECMVELQKTADGVIRQTFGGDTLNSAAYFSRIANRFGMRAEYVSALGDDTFSIGMRKFWSEENVGSALTRTMPGRTPGLYFIEVDSQGERTFTYWRGEAAVRDTFAEGDGDAVLERLGEFDAVYLSGISLAVLRGNGRDRLLTRLATLKATGKRIFFDCNFRPRIWAGEKTPEENARPWYERVIACSDAVFVSRDEIGALGFATDAACNDVCEAIAAHGAQEVLLKDGDGECLLKHPGGIARIPARSVNAVVDTTAAGDSFSAAYIACRRLNFSPEESVGKAHILASSVISHKGAVIPKEAMPDLFPGGVNALRGE